MNDFPDRVDADLRIYDLQRNARRAKPSKGEIDEKRMELIHDWLEQADNAHEAVTETLTYHINAWAPIHSCLVDGDDMELGRIFRQKVEEYAKRCTRSQLENWIEGYDQ